MQDKTLALDERRREIIMGTIILLLICFVGICLIEFDNGISILGLLLSSISIILLIVVLLTSIFGMEVDPNLTEDVPYEIYSINDNIETNGRFFLGTGRIETTDYYYFYIKTDKGLKVEKLAATNTYIQETDEITPRVVYQYHKHIYPEWFRKWFIGDPNPHGEVTTIIKVPTNTVTTQYTLDLK